MLVILYILAKFSHIDNFLYDCIFLSAYTVEERFERLTITDAYTRSVGIKVRGSPQRNRSLINEPRPCCLEGWTEATESLRFNDVPRYRFIARVIIRDTTGREERTNGTRREANKRGGGRKGEGEKEREREKREGRESRFVPTGYAYGIV